MTMDTGQNHTAVDPGKYTIVWKFMPDDWARGISQLEAPGIMPYLVDGKAYERLQKEQGTELTAYGLCCGILLFWFEPERFWGGEPPESVHGFLQDVLGDLKRHFGIPSMEKMILGVAASVRGRHGELLASRMLTAGTNILPASSLIRSDLIHDVWALLEATDDIDRESAFGFIVRVYEGIDFDEVDRKAIELLDYVCLVSLALCGKQHEKEAFFWRTVSKRVTHPFFKERSLRLLDDKDPDFNTYRIWNRKELYH